MTFRFQSISYFRKSLFCACENNTVSKVRSILQDGEDVDANSRNEASWTALMVACSFGYSECVNALLEHPTIDVNVQSNEGWTALMIACFGNHVDCVRKLLSYTDIRINIRDQYGRSALMISASSGDCATLLLQEQETERKQLIDVNVINENSGNSPLILACYHGNINCVRALLRRDDIDVNICNKDEKSALLAAIVEQKWTCALEILRQSTSSVDVNLQDKDGRSPLISACYHGNVDCVRALLRRDDIDVNLRERYGADALLTSLRRKHSDCALALLNDRASNIRSYGYDGKRYLLVACLHGTANCVRLLMYQDDIDINFVDKYGDSILLRTTKRNQWSCALVLLEHEDIDINIKDTSEATSLIYACCYDKTLEFVRVLLRRADVDVNACEHNGYNGIMVALRVSNWKCALEMLEHPDIDLNIKDKKDKSALDLACSYGRSDFVGKFVRISLTRLISITESDFDKALLEANGQKDICDILMKFRLWCDLIIPVIHYSSIHNDIVIESTDQQSPLRDFSNLFPRAINQNILVEIVKYLII